MLVEERELSSSSNGDRWCLVREPRSARVFVRHQANGMSGTDVSLMEIADFLTQGNGPEQMELLRLIGTLVNSSDRRTGWNAGRRDDTD